MIDIVAQFAESEAFHTMLVLTDWYNKVQHYFLAKTTWGAVEDADASINEVCRQCDLTRHIPSDRGLQVTFLFLPKPNWMHNMHLWLLPAYQLQMDILLEWVVQTLQQYLYINNHDRQHHCLVYLFLAEFAYSAIPISPLQLFPYRSVYGIYPYTIELNETYKVSSPTTVEWFKWTPAQ